MSGMGEYWILDWDAEDHADDLTSIMRGGTLLCIVSEESGGIIGYAIGEAHAQKIVNALNDKRKGSKS